MTSNSRKYAGQSTAQRRGERRRKLVQAGIALFGTAGFSSVAIDELCVEAGVGIRALYEEFGDKEALLRAAYDTVINTAFDRSQEKALQGDVRGTLEALLSTFLDEPSYGRIACIETSGVSTAMNEHRHREMKRFIGMTSQLLASRVPARKNNIWATMLAGGINELVTAELVSPTGISVADLAEEVLLFLRIEH